MSRRFAFPQAQRGAALVVGMVLLLVLTVLAISGMSTSITELRMAGNTSSAAAAYQASEAGIEQVIADDTTGAKPLSTSPLPVITAPQAVPNRANDNYGTTVTFMGTTAAPAGYSAGTFCAFHFQIQSTGGSTRNALATHTQGMFLVNQVDSSGC